MSLESYVSRNGRSLIGYLIVTPRDILPAFRLCHFPVAQNPIQPELLVLLPGWRVSKVNCLGSHSYSAVSRAKETQPDGNEGSILRFTSTSVDTLWLRSEAPQPGAGLRKQSTHISKTHTSTKDLVSTLTDSGQALSNEPGRQSAHIQRVDAVSKRLQNHRERKNLIRTTRKKKGSWSHDWQIPLKLLKQHYKAEIEEQALKGRPRAVWFNNRNIIRQVRADQIARPQVWSLMAFHHYVEDLTSSTVDRLMQHQIYGSGESHVIAVASVLERLFLDVDMKRFLSPKACNVALHFFYKHAMLSKARFLYTRMEDLHLEIEPETFNVMLRGSASNKDLHNFTFHLQNMVKRAYSPTSKTWSSLLMAVESSEARAVIVQAMRARKLLNRYSTMREVVDLTIRDEVVKHLDGCNEISTFFTSMDTRYPPGWLTVSAANSMLDEVCMQRSALKAFGVLQEIDRRVPTLDRVSLNTLLTHCREIRAHDLAIDVLDYFEVNHGISPRQKEYDNLFKQAWRGRLYNFARVIWRSACLEAAVTFAMQKLVIKSLTSKAPGRSNFQPMSRAEIWKAAAGKVIIGIEIAAKEDNPDEAQTPGIAFPTHVQDFGDERRNPSAHHEKVMDDAKVIRPTLSPLRSAKALLGSDLAAYKTYGMKGKLTPLLREALALDREWAKGNWRDTTTTWKCRNAIVVGVRAKGAAQDVLFRNFEYTL